MTPGGILSRVGTSFFEHLGALENAKMPRILRQLKWQGRTGNNAPPQKKGMILILSEIIFESQK